MPVGGVERRLRWRPARYRPAAPRAIHQERRQGADEVGPRRAEPGQAVIARARRQRLRPAEAVSGRVTVRLGAGVEQLPVALGGAGRVRHAVVDPDPQRPRVVLAEVAEERRCEDVVDRRRVLGVHPVERRVDESECRPGRLVGVRDDPREDRRGEARAAVAGRRVQRERQLPEGERLVQPDQEAGARVGVERDVRIDPERDRPVDRRVALRQVGRDDAGLVPRLQVVVARVATADPVRPGGQPGVHGACRAARFVADDVRRAQERAARVPAVLADPRAVGADLERGAADRRDVRAVGRVVRRREPGEVEVVTVVAGGELLRDSLRAGLNELVVVRRLGRRVVQQVAGGVRPRVGHDVGEVVVDHVLHRAEQPGVGAVGSSDVDDVGVGGHRVDRLDVDRLLGEPARCSALRLIVVRRHVDLREVSRRERLARRIGREVLGRVGADRRRVVRVDDRDRRTCPGVGAREPVTGPQLAGLVAADDIRHGVRIPAAERRADGRRVLAVGGAAWRVREERAGRRRILVRGRIARARARARAGDVGVVAGGRRGHQRLVDAGGADDDAGE